MPQKIVDYFNSENFMPHGHCFLWQPDILWLHIIADAATALAYFLIPCALIYYVRKKRDIHYPAIYLLFGAFILLCGITHLFDIWVLWHPDYALQGILKAITGIVSLITFIVLLFLMPRLLDLTSTSQLEMLNAEIKVYKARLAQLLGNDTKK